MFVQIFIGPYDLDDESHRCDSLLKTVEFPSSFEKVVILFYQFYYGVSSFTQLSRSHPLKITYEAQNVTSRLEILHFCLVKDIDFSLIYLEERK